MDYVTINNSKIPYPNDFTIAKEKILAGEYTTLTGQVIGDVVGWKYSDFTLSWDTLTENDLQIVLSACDDDTFTFTFADPQGEQTLSLTALSRAVVKTRFIENGVAKWKNIKIPVRCNNVYNY